MQVNGMEILKIGDRKYGMRKMPPLQGAAFGLKVSKALSAILSNKESRESLMSLKTGMAGKNEQLTEQTALSFGTVILGLLSNINPEEISEIFKIAMSYEVYCGTDKLSDELNFDSHFRKYPGDLYVVSVWATYNHVKDFFTGIGDGLKALMGNSETARKPSAERQ